MLKCAKPGCDIVASYVECTGCFDCGYFSIKCRDEDFVHREEVCDHEQVAILRRFYCMRDSVKRMDIPWMRFIAQNYDAREVRPKLMVMVAMERPVMQCFDQGRRVHIPKQTRYT